MASEMPEGYKKLPFLMAFEKLYDYTDRLAAAYQEAEKAENWKASSAYLESLTAYGETVLASAKFKSQRLHWVATMKRIAPAYSEGYFSPKKSKK
jgi:hypothetical protein